VFPTAGTIIDPPSAQGNEERTGYYPCAQLRLAGGVGKMLEAMAVSDVAISRRRGKMNGRPPQTAERKKLINLSFPDFLLFSKNKTGA